jgi:putative membrane protein (TIGR04086 family)
MDCVALNIRAETLLALLKGIGSAILITLAGMVLLSAIVVFFPVSDGALLALNQILKIASIFFGALIAVGFGGKRGFALGAAIGLIYMVLGYALYCLLDRSLSNAVQMTGEFLLGALIGALSGAVVANIRPSRHKRFKGRKKRTSIPA